MDAFNGRWTANLEKSRRHANHQFASATLTFAFAGDVVTMTHTGINASGKEESGVTTIHLDGLEHAISPQAPGVVAVARSVGALVIETEARKDGQVLGKGTYAVSDGGQTLTATVAGVDGAGKAFEQVIVFDRG
ncbi:MAG: hypothetical protein A3J29_19685 [Acidobacteria bacterium RIFCSPLOWO2_12_FULL_67_14b]|nr:MAG: hypothetical protein A3J29_19685 [Acidobacteria bacterium RIFCSPLOWO2_12_FULL_67_14b]